MAVGAARAHRADDFAKQFHERLASFLVLGRLLVLDVMPLAMASHSSGLDGGHAD